MRYGFGNYVEFSVLKDKTLARIDQGEGYLRFVTIDGETYRMEHNQECCESVYLEDITGNLDDLIGAPILKAEESSSSDSHPEDKQPEYEPECFTWTFYHLATIKGYVSLRWYGESNGYYSTGVELIREDA